MSRKVSYARFHQGLYHPQIGDIGLQLPSPNKKFENLVMNFEDFGLDITFVYGGVSFAFIIPSPNITHVSLVLEPKAKATKEK